MKLSFFACRPSLSRRVPWLWSFTAMAISVGVLTLGNLIPQAFAQEEATQADSAQGDSGHDYVRELQKQAVEQGHADWGYWGTDPNKYVTWSSHSNRLIPVYTFGLNLKKYRGPASLYRDPEQVEKLYGHLPKQTVNPRAEYFDQTDIFRLQRDAVAAGKKYVILLIFDGMDWQTTYSAAVFAKQEVAYDSGQGTGLAFQDFDGVETDFGFMVTSPHNTGTKADVNSQTVSNPGGEQLGGYAPAAGGDTPWAKPASDEYLLGKLRSLSHAVTDSAASATSMTAGIKTFNGAINVDPEGHQVPTIAHQLQADHDFAIGVVTSVPISHATPAAAYAHNVSRGDYQDLTRDLVGLRSVSHRSHPLDGVDVLLGAGWGERRDEDGSQGDNYVAGNKYIADGDLEAIDYRHGGKYQVVTRASGQPGRAALMAAAREAYDHDRRLFGLFGVTGGQGRKGGHLPYQTADGGYNPFRVKYTEADVAENPRLADLTLAALGVLSKDPDGFWLMVESGDVDWANHSNDIDSSIGAVLSGDEAFKAIVRWVSKRNLWDDTALIVTADHGHYFVPVDPEVFVAPNDK